MSELIRVPDIGNDEDEVIELLVKVGDRIEAADGSVHWTTRPVDPIAYVQRCP